MAESTAISIKKFDGPDYKSWSLEVEIRLEHKQVLGIVDGTEVVLATGPVLDPAGFIGLCGNGLTPSKIDDFSSEPSL
jgi:hypothetical protein